MSVDIKNSFAPGDRYYYDFKKCLPSNGWCQFDTSQDASYFGNWINPLTYELLSYCEGDVTHTTCGTAEDFVRVVRETFIWHDTCGYKPAIDTMCETAIICKMDKLGLSDLTHEQLRARA